MADGADTVADCTDTVADGPEAVTDGAEIVPDGPEAVPDGPDTVADGSDAESAEGSVLAQTWVGSVDETTPPLPDDSVCLFKD